MARRKYVFGTVGLLTCAAFAIGFALPATAADGETPLDDLDAHTRHVIKQMADDPYIETVQLIQDAGINELNPVFAGTVMIDGSTDGVVQLRYLESASNAKKLLAIVDDLNDEAPLPIEAVPTTVNLGLIKEVAQYLSDQDGVNAAEYGVYGVTGVSWNMLTGRAILTTTDPASVERTKSESGSSTITVQGLEIAVEIDLGPAPEVGFHASRNNDSPS
ncbi:hypothetical protein ACYX8G_13915 [Microbacterium saperdae]